MIRIRALRAGLMVALLAVTNAGGARALDLRTALGEVLAANPTLAARREMAEAARQRVSMAGAWSNPMLEAGVVNVPATGRFDMDPMTMKMVGFAQKVPLSGANGLQRRAAREGARAEAAQVDVTRNEVIGAAWEAYADAYAAAHLVAWAVAHRGEMERMAEAARARYLSGAGRLDEVLQAEAERARVLVEEATYNAAARGARARLDALRGVVPGAAADTLDEPPAPRVPQRPDELLDAVSEGHPRLRALEADAARWQLGARAARRMLWPELELKGSWGFREPLLGMTPQDGMWSASAGLMLPVFARSRELAEGREMDAMAAAAGAERAAGVLDLAQQVIAAHAEALAAVRIHDLLADTVVTALRLAHEAAWSAYAAGRLDLWRVLESAHALYAEEQALTRAHQDLARAGARLVALTGRPDLVGLDLSLDAPRSTR